MAKFRPRNPPALPTPALHVWHSAPGAGGGVNTIALSQIPNEIYTGFVSPGSTKPGFPGLTINRITNKCLSLLPINTKDESQEKKIGAIGFKS